MVSTGHRWAQPTGHKAHLSHSQGSAIEVAGRMLDATTRHELNVAANMGKTTPHSWPPTISSIATRQPVALTASFSQKLGRQGTQAIGTSRVDGRAPAHSNSGREIAPRACYVIAVRNTAKMALNNALFLLVKMVDSNLRTSD